MSNDSLDWADLKAAELSQHMFVLSSTQQMAEVAASALRAAYARGQTAALRHAAAKALSYAERELYDELVAAADELEKQS